MMNRRKTEELILAFDLPQMWNAVMQTTIKNMAPQIQFYRASLLSDDGLDLSKSPETNTTFQLKFRYFLAKKIEKVSSTVINHSCLNPSLLKIVLMRDCSRRYNWRALLTERSEEYKAIPNSSQRRFKTCCGTMSIKILPLIVLIKEVIGSFCKDNLIRYGERADVQLFQIRIQNESINLVDNRELKIGVEADDIIAVMCERVNRAKAQLIAISNDGDFCQLLDRFANFKLYNIRGVRQTISYNSRLVPHLIALRGKRSSGLKPLLRSEDMTQIRDNINYGRIKRVGDIRIELLRLINSPDTVYGKKLLSDFEHNLKCISFQAIDNRIKTLIVNRLNRVPGLIN